MEYPDTEPMDTLSYEARNQMESEDPTSYPTSSYASTDLHSTAAMNSHSLPKHSSQPFQSLFTQDKVSLCESDSSVFRKQNPWDDDTSYKSDNFLPFLTTPKKLKLINNEFSKVSSGIKQSRTEQQKQIKPNFNIKQRSDGSPNVDSCMSGLSTAASSLDNESSNREEALRYPDISSYIADFELFKKTFIPNIKPPKTLSILELARKKFDEKTREVNTPPPPPSDNLKSKSMPSNKYSKIQLCPGYNPDEEAKRRAKSNRSWWGASSSKPEYPDPDPVQRKNFSLSRVKMLLEQFYTLIDEENENRRKVQEMQALCMSKYPNSDKLQKYLELAVGCSRGVLEEFMKSVRGLGRVEEHCVITTRVLEEMDYLKKEDDYLDSK